MNNKLIVRITIILAGIVLLAITFFTSIIFNNPSTGPSSSPSPTSVPIKPTAYVIKVGSQQLTVEIKQTLEEQQQGLSGRSFLAKDHGMLFVYSQPSIQQFWMKDMQFPIDIIWIDNGKVVGITDNIPPPDPNIDPDQLPAYPPPQPVTAVLEVNAGYTEKHNIIVGDLIELSNFQPSI